MVMRSPSFDSATRRRRAVMRFGALACLGAVAGTAALSAVGARKFYPDDPLAREPETQDASTVRAWDTPLSYDIILNLFVRPGDHRPIRALNVNTIDEVPDSSWFTNRVLARPLSVEELARGPLTRSSGPAPGPMTIVRAKPAGITPGFVLRDSEGTLWFCQFDAPGHDEAASGASLVANKIFHALGYWQAENYLAFLRPETLRVGDNAVVETPSGKVRRLNRADIDRVLARAARRSDGSYRMLASLAIPGRIIGGFRYHGTRPDDPNDVVPHEHRRELRALRVFGAWTNLVDLKAGNTLDTVLTENGRSFVRHYLQDVGSTFGTGALGPREWDEGYEAVYEAGPLWKRLFSFGFYLQPWQSIPYREFPSIGRFEGDHFDPAEWSPRVPPAAYYNARADDSFWAARRVMAFSDAMIRAAVHTGQYSDPEAARHLADVLIKRRDTIGRVYLNAVNPVVDPALDDSGALTFTNAAVAAGVAAEPSAGYRAQWYRFDNDTGEVSSIGAEIGTASTRSTSPGELPTSSGAFLRIDVSAHDPQRPAWAEPVRLYFRRDAAGWKWVGLEREP
jgi:hypothetical protein